MSNLTTGTSVPTIPTNFSQKMTSLEISELTNKNHKEVLRDIKSLIEQEAIHERSFALMSREVEIGNRAIRKSPLYELDFQATMTLITGYDAKRRSQVIARWIDLETGTPNKKTKILALEAEIKEGASLLTAVIGQQQLPESQKWQLVDRLLRELFGRGTELLLNNSGATGLSQPDCPGPDMYYVRVDEPLLVLKHARSGSGYQVALSSVCRQWFTTRCCQTGEVSCSQQTLYKLFRTWFMESFHHHAPSFRVFHDVMVKQYREITLVGEPWFVGIAPNSSEVVEVA
jgi:phage regulator Rha-like protein